MIEELGKAQIGVSTFLASPQPTDACGTNGLPVTPNSIKVLGLFQELKLHSHPNLCKYIDVIRCKHERLVFVTEYYENNLALSFSKFSNMKDIQKLTHEVMLGLAFLHQHNYVHRNLSMKNILLDHKNQAKLLNYGLYHMTSFNNCVAFPIGDILYTSPEVISGGTGYQEDIGPSNGTVDVWSLGVVLLDCYMQGKLWGNIRGIPSKIARFLINLLLLKDNVDGLKEILKVSGGEEIADKAFHNFVSLCLTIDPLKRPQLVDLFSHDFLISVSKNYSNKTAPLSFHLFPSIQRSMHLHLLDFNKLLLDSAYEKEVDHLAERPMNEVYHLWCLAGGDVLNELKKQINSKPSLMNLPMAVLSNGENFDVGSADALSLDETVVSVNLLQLRQRLSHINPTAYNPLVIEDDLYPVDTSEAAKLPLVIREKNVEYQFHRIILFERLLNGYPHSRDRIIKEARIDIPPFVRARVWAALLNISGDIFNQYERIDKESFTPTDRQIEVDIPRCHQYNHLLASPTAHNKFKRILKAWVVAQKNLVYWQGLDSLCAPFIALSFNNEPLIYACLTAFIPKYLYNFFLRDNSQVIHEYLAVFSQLIAFHIPDLFNHLCDIGFMPELYAIPWFLTMFSHVFPLEQIFHLWDTLLLGSSMLPLCIGVAILLQFKEQLLSFGFNECILLFSDMPSIDIERCVKDSIKLFNHTPPSSSLRKQDNLDNRTKAPFEESFMNLPEKDFIPLSQLKLEACVRISPRDLVRISHLVSQDDIYTISSKAKHVSKKRSKQPTAATPLTKILVLDLRAPEEFSTGHLPNSVNMPFNLAFDESNKWISSPSTAIIEAHKGRMILIMGPKGPQPMLFGQLLVGLGFRRVAVMDGSTSILRGLGYFSAV